MPLQDLLVLLFIISAFGAFIFTLAWASRPPRSPARTAKNRSGKLDSKRNGLGVAA